MKCLYCGKRLALLRKLTDSEFCTDAHRRAYQKEQEQMALARLSDAGKPKKKANPEPEKPILDPKDEPQFVEWKHRAADWSAVRRLDTEPLFAEPSRFLPEDCVRMEAWPAPAGSLPVRQPEEKVIPPEWLPADPSPQPVAVEIRWPSAAVHAHDVALDRLGARQPLQEPAATNVKHGSLVSPFGPLTDPHSPQLPVFGDGRLMSMPTAQDVVVQLTTLETAMMTHGDPVVDFPAKPLISGMGSGLHVSEYSIEHRDIAHDGVASLPSVLLTMKRPEPRPGKRGARKVRPRELFFPLPRLGDLSTTASRLGGKNIAVVSPGTNSKRWKPGAIPITFRTEVLNDQRGKGISAFPQREADATRPRHLPTLQTVARQFGGLGEAGRIDDIRLFLAGDSAQDAPIRIACELTAESMQSGAARPLLWVWLPEPVVTRTSALDPLSPNAVPATCASRQSAYQPFAPQPEALRLPQASALSSRPFAVDRPMTMAPVTLEVVVPASHQALGAASEFLLAKPTIEASSPGSILRREYEPAFARKVVPLPSESGVPYPRDTVAIQDLSPVWPDPEFLYPHSRNNVIEDSAMREAVKAMSVLLLADENRSFFSRLSLPFSRSDSKWLVMSIPAVLLLSLYLVTNRNSQPDLQSLPQAAEVIEVPEPSADPEPQPVEAKPVVQQQAAVEKAPAPPAPKASETAAAVLPAKVDSGKPEGFLGGIQQTIMQRAAVNLSDDFRSGLGDWEGEGDWSKKWAYDAAGFLHTGPLILYKPSLPLTDYRMEFLGRIEKKSMGWVYRAADRRNYYAHRIVLTTGGPLPSAVVERYAVIGGKTYSMARRPLPMQVQTDTSYRVRMDVRGNGFTLSVQGQVVDHWSDDRLKTGGIGFFSARGEQASLRWVELSHQYDFLGRLCAFLAPYSLPAKEGSLK